KNLPSSITTGGVTFSAVLLTLFTLNLSLADWRKVLSRFSMFVYVIATSMIAPFMAFIKRLSKTPHIERVRATKERHDPSLRQSPPFKENISAFEKNKDYSPAEAEPMNFEIVQPTAAAPAQKKPSQSVSSSTPRNVEERPLELSEARNIALPP
ncbi:MAG: hypothetical protein ACTHJ4_02700, partial [Candidatus Nucleicultricaceae bacterium]